ncbi:hypothetical protein GCM10022240_28190 [Microbacterium kribbense]|uniref:HNH endonuclease n=1 Tax=Microbacterium kribbense TaxID=433645 RepID=A0ABP7GT92_9MICO
MPVKRSTLPRRACVWCVVEQVPCGAPVERGRPFPGCRRPAQKSDIDHTRGHAEGGPTCLCNLASSEYDHCESIRTLFGGK